MRIEDGPAAALVALLLQTLGRGFAQRQVWFGAGLDVGRVRSVHGLAEGLGDGRAPAGLQREHTRDRGLSVDVRGRACCRDCRRYHGVATEEGEEEEEEGEGEDRQERIINNGLPPPRHYFRGVAARSGGAGVGVVVTREHVSQQQHSTARHSTAQHRTTDGRTPACMDGAVVCKRRQEHACEPRAAPRHRASYTGEMTAQAGRLAAVTANCRFTSMRERLPSGILVGRSRLASEQGAIAGEHGLPPSRFLQPTRFASAA